MSGFYIVTLTLLSFRVSRSASWNTALSKMVSSNSNVINVQSARPQHQTRIGSGSQSWVQRFSGGKTPDGTRGGELCRRSRTKASLRTGVDRRHDR